MVQQQMTQGHQVNYFHHVVHVDFHRLDYFHMNLKENNTLKNKNIRSAKILPLDDDP